jgi:hypothetical protein
MVLMVDQLRENDSVVSLLMEAMNVGEGTLREFPGLLKRVLREGMWRERYVQTNGRVASFRQFIDFVHTPPREGLGADIPTLKRLCADDPEAIDEIDKAVLRSKGNPHSNGNNVINYVRPLGNRADQALRRLRKDRKDLHARVVAGEMSPHAAMVEAGFRPRTLTIPVDADRVVCVLRRHFSADECRLIGARLLEDA